jgi:hypothetical protein
MGIEDDTQILIPENIIVNPWAVANFGELKLLTVDR